MQPLAGGYPAHLYIWDNRVLYTGPAMAPRYRCYGSTALVVGIEDKLRVHRQTHAGEVVESRCCLIRPGLPVYLDSDSPSLLVLFLDPFLHDLEALQDRAARQTHGIHWALDDENAMVALARQVLGAAPSPRAVLAMLAKLGLPATARLDPRGVDPRVTRAVSLIRDGRTRNITTEDIAAAVSLSVPRVIQLFRQYLGVSAGRYRQWHRLHATTLGIARGHSFTRAAVASGFSDLAHFSNTFHSMIGIMPSRLLRAPCGIQFHVDPQLATEGFSILTGINNTDITMC